MSEIIKQDLFDNTIDSTIVINPTKQQIVFFPKEESQMFTSRTADYVDGPPGPGLSSNPDTESEDTSTVAFMQRVQNSSTVDEDLELMGVSLAYPANYVNFKFNLPTINSSHTATDYIGASTVQVPTIILDAFTDFNLYNISTDATVALYADSDIAAKVKTIVNGVQSIRIPTNILNTILTDSTDIANNNNSNILKNFGKYYVIISPKFIQVTIGIITERKHVEWLSMIENAVPTVDGDDVTFEPDSKRRNIYECDKEVFMNLPWNFEASGDQSGRLYGSVVEVWDSSVTTLKQIKVMTENEFNFNNVNSMQFVLYPDNVGYDAPGQEIISGDVIKIYPRETYFDQIVIEINYVDKTLELKNLLAFMLNDTVRNMLSGVYDIYDSAGFTIDNSGAVNGNVINSYQIFKTDKYEARKRIK